MSILELVGRTNPLLEQDINNFESELSTKVENSSFIVIGGAGSIGQAVTKEIFARNPKKLQVVDISENYLNAIILKDEDARNQFLDYTNSKGVMTRPIWRLMNELEMYKSNQCGDLTHSKWLEERVVNIPSSVI